MKYLSKFLSMLLIGTMLYATGCTDYDADIKDLNDKIEGIESTLNGKVDPLAAELDKVAAALEDAIKDANENIAANEEAMSALKDADDEISDRIDDALEAIEAASAAINDQVDDVENMADEALSKISKANETIAAHADAIAALEGVDEELAGDIQTLQANLATMEAELDGKLDKEDFNQFITAFVAYQAEIDAAIAALEVRVANAEAAIEALEGNVAELYDLHDVQGQLIENLDGRHEDLAAYTEAELEALRKADANLAALIAALGDQLDAFKQTVTDQFAKAFGEIAANTTKINELTAALAQEAAERIAMGKAIYEHIDNVKAELKNADEELEAKFSAITDALAKEVAAVKSALAELKEEVNNLNGDVEALQSEVAALQEALSKLKDETEDAVARLSADINAILNRVQSIVFVPEYNDGKGTINYAKAGETLVEARSTMVYQVYPAEGAAAIALSEEAVLSYNLEGLKSRAAEGPQFNIVAVEGTEDGRLIVTFDARNLGAEFYAGQKEYAASLVLDSETANLSTVYTNVVPVKTPEQITMNIVNGEEVISGLVGDTYEFEYTDTETVEKVLPEHVVVFDVDGTSYVGIEALNNAGYAVALERAMYFDRYQASLGYRPFDINENEDSIYEIKVKEINGTLIANPVDVGYIYTAGTLKAEAYVRYSTSPVKADVKFEGVSATWTYNQDAPIDAAKSGAYNRGLDLTLVDHNLPEDVTLDMVFADAPVSIEAYIGEEVATDVVAEILVKDGKKYGLQINNFAWDKSYVVKAVYEVKDKVLGDVCAIATVTIPFNTYDRNREPIVINLDPSTIDFEANVESFNEISDNLDVVYETLVFGNKNFDISSDKWLEQNFGVGCWTATEFVVADGKEVTLPSGYNTYLAIDGASNGQTVYTNFSYNDFDFVPAQVEYTKTVTTWYGQVIVLNKVLNFEFPVYDFKHNSKYVYGADADFYSQVQPEYTWKNDNEDEGLLKFDVAKVILRAAFDVIDANGKKLTPAEQAALSLKYNFVIEDEEHVGIDINADDELSYYGANPYVNVRANLYIVHNNGAKYTVPTSFDEGGKYASYNVVKFNPIGTAEVIKNPTVDVNNAIAYNVHVLDYVKLDDHRMGGRQNWPLITNGAWVAGSGLNGFAQGVDVRADYMYRINEVWVNDTSDVDEEIRPYITLNNGTLTFDNSQQLELTAPFTVPVTLKFQNCWMEKPQQVTVKVTFNPIK